MGLFALRSDQRLLLQLSVSVWVSVANGAQFCFALLTPYMKGNGRFNYTQTEVTLVATVGAVASFFSLPTGYFYDRFGPRPTLMAGSLLNLLGWLGMYAFFASPQQPLLGTSPMLMCVFYGLSQLSASFFETGSVLTNLEAFSSQQGFVIIIQKTFMGLGSSVITTYYLAFFAQSNDISKFCLFLATFNFAMGIVGAAIVKIPSDHERVKGLNLVPPQSPVMGSVSSATRVSQRVVVSLADSLPEAAEAAVAAQVIIRASHRSERPSAAAVAGSSPLMEVRQSRFSSAPSSAASIACAGDRRGGGGGAAREDPSVAAVRSHMAEEEEAGRQYARAFRLGYAVLFLCMAFLTATAIAEDFVELPQPVLTAFGFIITSLVLAFFLMMYLVPALRSPCCDGDNSIVEPLIDASSGRGSGDSDNFGSFGSAGGGGGGGGGGGKELGEGRGGGSGGAENGHEARGRASGDRDGGEEHHQQQQLRHRPSNTSELYSDSGAPDAFPTSEQPTSPLVIMRHRVFAKNERTMPQNMRRLEMWLLWYVSFSVWGAGIIVSNNSAQIYKALDFDGYRETVNTVYVSIFGVASALGRIIVGAIDGPLKSRGTHISALFPIAPILNVFGLPLFLLLPPRALILPFFLAGLSTGFSWGSTVLIVKSLFVRENVGKHYNVLYTAGMLTPIVFSVGLFASVYDHHSEAQGRAEDHTCEGVACVLWPLLVPVVLNAIAAAAAYLFFRRVNDRGGFIY